MNTSENKMKSVRLYKYEHQKWELPIVAFFISMNFSLTILINRSQIIHFILQMPASKVNSVKGENELLPIFTL